MKLDAAWHEWSSVALAVMIDGMLACDVIRGGSSLSYSNKLWYQQQYLFIYFI